MPRKQRFKPSRKPQSTTTQVASRKLEDRHEIPLDDIEPEPRDSERALTDDGGSEVIDEA